MNGDDGRTQLSDQLSDQDLIRTLQADLTPVRARLPLSRVALIWLLLSTGYVFALGLALGPFRPEAVGQLIGSARFSLEMMMGFGAVSCFLWAALGDSIPGMSVRWIRRVAWVLMAGWLSQFLIGFQLPTFEPSMLGKREHCAWEAYLYSVPPLLCLVWLQRRRFVLQPVRAVLHAALAAALIPALMMQLACMYEPGHILKFHVLPVAILSAAAVVVTWVITRQGD